MCVCREGERDRPAAAPEEAQVLPGAAGQAAVQRLERAAHEEDPRGPQGHPSPPKKPFRTPPVPSLCVMATRATVTLMTGKRSKTAVPAALSLDEVTLCWMPFMGVHMRPVKEERQPVPVCQFGSLPLYPPLH